VGSISVISTKYTSIYSLGHKLETVESEGLRLHVWDIGGQRDGRQFWKNYLVDVSGIIWCIDSSDKLRLTETGRELNKILKIASVRSSPLVIFANKQVIALFFRSFSLLRPFLRIQDLLTAVPGILSS